MWGILNVINYVIVRAYVHHYYVIFETFVVSNRQSFFDEMPRGRKSKKRPLEEQNVQEAGVTKKRQNATPTGMELAVQVGGRSTRSTGETSDRRRTDPASTGKESKQFRFEDPRKILYKKSTNNNATPGNSQQKTGEFPGAKTHDPKLDGNSKEIDQLGKNGKIPSDGMHTNVNGNLPPGPKGRHQSTSAGVVDNEDPGLELDYEDNLDLDVTVTGEVPAETDREGSSEDEDANLVNLMKGNPRLKRLFKQIVEEGGMEQQQPDQPQPKKAVKSVVGKGNNPVNSGETATHVSNDLQDEEENIVTKSLSDSTIYAPALNKHVPEAINGSPTLSRQLPNVTGNIQVGGPPWTRNLVDRISDFIGQVRLDMGQTSGGAGPSTANDQQESEDDQQALDPDTQAVRHARQLAQDKIVEAEKFRANVQVTQGMCNPDNNDEIFFMNTCHTEEAMTEKIGKGNFIDMNKIYPRQNDYKASLDNRMEIINKDGRTYFVPANENSKRVYNHQTWQKAFRVYATIYSRANPHRAAEILQYMDVIGNAASTFAWENVAAYDYIHRQLMHQKPNRTWSKIYLQGWSMTMKDHLTYKSNGGQNRKGGTKKNIDPYCWRFNKNNCCRVNCRFEHKCSYCGATGHGVISCRKKPGTEGGGSQPTEDKRIVEQTK